MKTWKLVSGILSIVLFVLVAFQSCAAGVYNSLADNAEVSGTAGIILAVFMLASGIVSICTRKGGKGGNIATLILYGIAAIVGFANAGSFADLNIWAGWCAICAVLALIALFKKTNSTDSNISNIKKMLDKWGTDSGLYGKFSRVATRIDYTKGIYLFFILCIQKYS